VTGQATWRVDVVTDPEHFMRVAGVWLVSHAVDANVIGSALAGVLAQPAAERPEVLWLLVRDDDDKVAGAAMYRDDLEVFLPELPPQAAEALAGELARRGVAVPGSSGDEAASRAFTLEWHRLTGVPWTQGMASRLYVLDALREPPGVPGALRIAAVDDVGLCSAWAEAFVAESAATALPGGQRHIVSRRIAAGEVWLWEVDGERVSMAAASPVVGGVARVNLVYTPPSRRGHGFGAAVSAGVTARALESGADTCMLYADVANQTSNALYRRIGFRPFGESVTYRFG
jgi:predicted GNAT family acetyltransferase